MLISPRSIQFAVVREDPHVERALVEELAARRVLLIASGGCTALALRGWFPDLEIVLVDPNRAQIDHVEAKLAALRADGAARARAFNVGSDDPAGLHECGNFERLFRHFRQFLDLFVVTAAQRAQRLRDAAAAWDDVVGHPYWPVAFEVTFADAMLRTMFGPDAVQHAAPGSYPEYFRRRVESAVRAPDRATNPFLHHLLLGCYAEERESWPAFLRTPPRDLDPFDSEECTLLEMPSFAEFDLVQLSNIVDWMDTDACRALAGRLGQELRPGAAVVWRQLNDPRPIRELFEDRFTFDAARDARLLTAERSFFYDQVHAGVHR